MKKLFFLVCVLPLFNACDYDNVEDLYGVSSCDTESVSFTNDIVPIIESHCVSCHSGSSPSGSLDLLDFESLSESALNIGVNGLLNRIGRSEGSSGAMPTNYKLTDCQIEQINSWIEQGLINN